MKFLKLASLFGLFAIAACGGTKFEDVCEDGCNTTCAGQDPLDADEKETCLAACDRLKERVETADCEDEANDLAKCGEDYTCDPEGSSACQSETTALSRCFNNFCTENPENDVCTTPQTT